MKQAWRTFWWLVLGLGLPLLPVSLSAQITSGSIVAEAATCITLPGSTQNCVQATLNGNQASAAFAITGTWAGTINFEVNVKSATPVALTCFPYGSSIGVTTTTANGTWYCSVPAAASVQVRIGTGNYSSGTAVVTLRVSTASAGSGGGGARLPVYNGSVAFGPHAVINQGNPEETTHIGPPTDDGRYKNVLSVNTDYTLASQVGTAEAGGSFVLVGLNQALSDATTDYIADYSQIYTYSGNTVDYALIQGLVTAAAHIGSGTVNLLSGAYAAALNLEFGTVNTAWGMGLFIEQDAGYIASATLFHGDGISGLGMGSKKGINISPMASAPTVIGVDVGAITAAYSGTLTSDSTNVADAATAIIGSKTYTFKTTLAACSANDIKIGTTAALSLYNLGLALTDIGIDGANYCAGTTANAAVTGYYITGSGLILTVLGTTTSTLTGATHLTASAATLAAGTADAIRTALTGDIVFGSVTATSTTAAVITDTNGKLSTLSGVSGTTGRATAQVAANNSVVSVPNGAADASYIVSANVLVTTATVHNFTVTVAYTDEGNTSRTLTMNFSTVAGVIATTIVNTGGAAPYEGLQYHIRAKANTAITIATVGTFTTVTYNVEGYIAKIG